MRTALFDQHLALKAKIVPFAGWEMPLNYPLGILQEHKTVRETVGIFDISHMGRIKITGNEAIPFLEFIITNHLPKEDLAAVYTVLCNENGTTIDDVIVYRQNVQNFFLIANASNREKDLQHLQNYAVNYEVNIEDMYTKEGILAIQGPKALKLVSKLFPRAEKIKPMHFQSEIYDGETFILSRTGYTGEKGFEVFAPLKLISTFWNLFLKEGKSEGIAPIGLGARDLLRLEMGYALYGHELSETIYPTESVSSWTVKFDKKSFLGKAALHELKFKRYAYGIKLSEGGIAREGYEVFQNGTKIGYVTSGSFSPQLNCSIALILADKSLHSAEEVWVKIRTRFVKAIITSLPFINISHEN